MLVKEGSSDYLADQRHRQGFAIVKIDEHHLGIGIENSSMANVADAFRRSDTKKCPGVQTVAGIRFRSRRALPVGLALLRTTTCASVTSNRSRIRK